MVKNWLALTTVQIKKIFSASNPAASSGKRGVKVVTSKMRRD